MRSADDKLAIGMNATGFRRTVIQGIQIALLFGAGILLFVGCKSESLNIGPENDRLISRALEKVSRDNLVRTMQELESFGTRFTWEKQEEVAAYLTGRLGEYGIKTVIDEYSFKEKQWKNIMGVIEGAKNEAGEIFVIAHYDSISPKAEIAAPGADDNASGTAAALEVSRILKDAHLDSGVIVLFFSNEEQGRLGSQHFTKKAKIDGRRIKGVLNLDVIGYNDAGWPFAVGSEKDQRLSRFLKRTAKSVRNVILRYYYPYGRVTIAGRTPNGSLVKTVADAMEAYTRLNAKRIIGDDCGCGDEGPFWDEGYDAVYVNSYYLNPYRETCEDFVKYLDPDFIAEVTKGAVAAVAHLGNSQR